MMVLAVSLIGAIFIFLLVYYLVMTKLLPRTEIRQRMRNIRDVTQGQRSRSGGVDLSDIPLAERTVLPFFKSISGALLFFAPKGIYERLEKRIMLAGKQGVWSATAFVCGWVLSVVGCLLLAFFFLSGMKMPFIQRVALLAAGGAAGAFLPFAMLNSLIRARQKKILRQLPDFLDLLCVSVQAGLSFDGSVRKIIARMKGPLIEECERMQRDMQMGMPRKRSLQQMAKRCDVQEVYLFTTSVIQSERLGTSMANTLENQAANMRERRRQTAKAEALRAPVKIVFPLVFFIFPAMFVVVLLPSLLFLIKQM